MTSDHNFFTKFHFRACNMSFYRFYGMMSRLRSSDLSFESPNDLQMTSKWPQVTHNENITFLPNLTLGHVICFFIGFFGRLVDCAYQIRFSSHQMTSKWPLVMFSDQYGSLEVIKRSFCDWKFKSDKRNRLDVPKNLWKDILHAPKWDLVRKLCFQVLMGHMRSLRGHLEII